MFHRRDATKDIGQHLIATCCKVILKDATCSVHCAGSECEDLLSSDVSVSSSQTGASTPRCEVQDHSKKLLLNGSLPIAGSLVAPSRLSSA